MVVYVLNNSTQNPCRHRNYIKLHLISIFDGCFLQKLKSNLIWRVCVFTYFVTNSYIFVAKRKSIVKRNFINPQNQNLKVELSLFPSLPGLIKPTSREREGEIYLFIIITTSIIVIS